ncbi:MAG TPA: ATP-binding protein [Candidatus Angelobacter sp.]|nr:ATP-binding protein [Candidatus Angelobacter sp.]
MPETDQSEGEGRAAILLGDLGRSISAKLMVSIFLVGIAIFLLLGYLGTRLHREHLEAAALVSAEQQSEVLRRSASHYMLNNDRNGLYEMMSNMADQPGVVRVRILNSEGVVSYSTLPSEVGSSVNKDAEACYGCHEQSKPLTLLKRSDRFRVYRAGGTRVLGIITPIENQLACSNAACHAHPDSVQILGVLDTNLSLQTVDVSLAQEQWAMLTYTGLALFLLVFLSGLFIWVVVHNPLRALKAGTERVAKGELGFQIQVRSNDEVGDLAESFNAMNGRLQLAQEEITAWAHPLEDRVEEKTRELKQAHQHMLQVEKMATIGKMAAVVAHEINNPLSGILTYSRVVKRWIQNNFSTAPRCEEMSGSLDLIASESKRCGELVKNLLSFSRVTPMNLEWCELNQVIDRCIRLVQHKMDMATIQLNLALGDELPHVRCDPNQIEQVVLAMVINAIDALPQGGNLWITTRQNSSATVELMIRDDGIGIPDIHLAHIFEPFYTTKENGGSGLGLAISQTIVERHGGSIAVNSRLGQGTTFTILLPVDSQRVTLASDANLASAEPAPFVNVSGEVVIGRDFSRAAQTPSVSSPANFSPRASHTAVVKNEVEK